jgi:hypothetical protein
MRKINKVLFTVGLLFGAVTIEAQEKEVETTIAADIVNQYIWRGQDLGNVSFQPTLGVSYQGFSLSAWGSVGLSDSSDTKEFDLTATYTIGGLSFGITDYWFNVGLDPKNRYFKYDAHGTNHIFEATIGYDFGVMSLQWFTNFAGNDGVNKSGKRAYSSYAEASVPFRLGSVDWVATGGIVPFSTTSYATSGFSVTNLSLKAIKELKLTDTFSIPIFGQIIANPCAQKAYLVFGFTMQS